MITPVPNPSLSFPDPLRLRQPLALQPTPLALANEIKEAMEGNDVPAVQDQPRRRAESSLSAAAASSGFSLAVLNLVATDPVDEQIRLVPPSAARFPTTSRQRTSTSSSPSPPMRISPSSSPSLSRSHPPPQGPHPRLLLVRRRLSRQVLSFRAELSGHAAGVSDLSFSADGRFLCSDSGEI